MTHLAASQRRLGPLASTRWYEDGRLVERHWWLGRWVFARPAHPGGFVPLSERYGLRKTWHVFGGCLSRRKAPTQPAGCADCGHPTAQHDDGGCMFPQWDKNGGTTCGCAGFGDPS